MTIQQAISIIERVDICCNQAETARNMALEALREKAERENPEPLTVKELRQMEGEAVWVKIIDASNFCDPKDAFDDYGLVRKSWVRMWDRSRADIITVSHHFEEYGKIWLAYRNRPKEAE